MNGPPWDLVDAPWSRMVAPLPSPQNYILECVADARISWRHAFKIREYVRGSVRKFADARVPELVSGKLCVSVTRLPSLRNARVSQFATVEEFSDTLLASSCTTTWPPLRWRKKLVVGPTSPCPLEEL